MSFIQEIFKKGANKLFPRPGPGSYFLSSKSLKKLGNEKAELMKSVETNKILEIKRGPSLKAKREFSIVVNYEEKKKQPGPSNYYPFVSSGEL